MSKYDQLGSQNQQQQEEAPRIYFVIAGLKSKHTKRAYRMAFNHFLDVTIKSKDLSALLNTKQSVIESKIIDYVTYLKDVERLTYRTISVHLSAIFHFFEINDYDDLRRKKIKRFMPEDESEYYSHQQDRAYSIPELEQILKKCDIRARVAVLLMLSSGLRIGGLHELQLCDIKKIDEFGLYMIWVYNRSRKHRYYTFCSRECTSAIDEYLSYRQKFGDPLKSTSPLIRDKFSVDNPFTAQAPRLLSLRSMSLMFEEVLKHAKLNPLIPGQKKRAVPTSHGFRRFFITQCDRSGMSFTTREYLSGHRLPNLDASYIRVTEEDRLAEYVKAIDLLTIDPTKRLEQKVQDLEGQQAQEIERLKAQLQGYKEEQEARAKQSHDFSKQAFEELYARIDATEDKHEKMIRSLEYAQRFALYDNEREKKELEEMSPEYRKGYLEWDKSSEKKKGMGFHEYYVRKSKHKQWIAELELDQE